MEEIRLNIGCGEYPIKGFVNIDVYEGKNVDLVCNALKLPYENNSIDEIYCGHMIEHLSIKEAEKVLKEFLRVLKPLGKLGIVIPDKDRTPPKSLIGVKVPDEPYREHHSYWNLEFLISEVKLAGFIEVKEMDIQTYPNLVARPSWQSGITATKKENKLSKEARKVRDILEDYKVDRIDESTAREIPKFNEREYSWCKTEKKVVYNPTKKRHCPYCKNLFEIGDKNE